MRKKTCWTTKNKWVIYIEEDIGCNRLGLHQSKMMEVMEDREEWRFNLKLLPPQPLPKSGHRKDIVFFAIFRIKSEFGMYKLQSGIILFIRQVLFEAGVPIFVEHWKGGIICNFTLIFPYFQH